MVFLLLQTGFLFLQTVLFWTGPSTQTQCLAHSRAVSLRVAEGWGMSKLEGTGALLGLHEAKKATVGH